MGDFSDLTKHPKFVYHGDPLELLEKNQPKQEDEGIPREVEEDERIRFGQKYCSDCTHRLDLRPWYQRWFHKASAKDYVCRVGPRIPVENPVTGEKEFLPYGEVFSSQSVPGAFHPCVLKNPTGNCRLFSLRCRF